MEATEKKKQKIVTARTSLLENRKKKTNSGMKKGYCHKRQCQRSKLEREKKEKKRKRKEEEEKGEEEGTRERKSHRPLVFWPERKKLKR